MKLKDVRYGQVVKLLKPIDMWKMMGKRARKERCFECHSWVVQEPQSKRYLPRGFVGRVEDESTYLQRGRISVQFEYPIELFGEWGSSSQVSRWCPDGGVAKDGRLEWVSLAVPVADLAIVESPSVVFYTELPRRFPPIVLPARVDCTAGEFADSISEWLDDWEGDKREVIALLGKKYPAPVGEPKP